ncbi:hypothetical protein DV515_00017995 [Chloebia gouldiae]|uniref:SH3 domain-containing protein n=1 Tax=Chloebia gouldiae TaxID=44316 RepID=A0A3L8Q8R2_CHLGU|nr:hypothetical protein DV515_00017995 [Chloebia gouldiae]
MEKVAKASGANYSFHKESSKFQDSGPQAPVGSVYQKTNAMSEIKRVNKDSFWAKAEKDEENRRLEEKRRAEEERQRLERERRERELQEAAGREQMFKARSSEIEAQNSWGLRGAEGTCGGLWQGALAGPGVAGCPALSPPQKERAEERRGVRRSESVEKAQEAATLIAQRAVNPRDIFKQRERAGPGAAGVPAQPGKLRSPFLQKEGNSVPSPASPGRDLWASPPASPGPAAGRDSGYNSGVPGSHVEENLYEEPPEPSAIYEEPPQNIITNIEMIDEGWWRGYGPDGHFGMFPANYVELIE